MTKKILLFCYTICFLLSLTAQKGISYNMVDGKANVFSFNIIGLDTSRLMPFFPAKYECFWEFGDGQYAIAYSTNTSPALATITHTYPKEEKEYRIRAYIRSINSAHTSTQTLYDTLIFVPHGFDEVPPLSKIPAQTPNIEVVTTSDLSIMPKEKMLVAVNYHAPTLLKKGCIIVGYGNKSTMLEKTHQGLTVLNHRPFAETKELVNMRINLLSETHKALVKSEIQQKYKDLIMWRFDEISPDSIGHIYLTLAALAQSADSLDKDKSTKLAPTLSILILAENHAPILKKAVPIPIVPSHLPYDLTVLSPRRIARHSFENEGFEVKIGFDNAQDSTGKNIRIEIPYTYSEKNRVEILESSLCKNGECVKWQFTSKGLQFYFEKPLAFYHEKNKENIPTKDFIRFKIYAETAKGVSLREDIRLQARIKWGEEKGMATHVQKVFLRDARWGFRTGVNSLWFTNKKEAPFQLLIPEFSKDALGKGVALMAKQLNLSTFYTFKLYPFNTYMSNRVELGVGTAFAPIEKQAQMGESIPFLPTWVKNAKYYEYNDQTYSGTYLNALYFKNFFIPNAWGTLAQLNVGAGLGGIYKTDKKMNVFLPFSMGLEVGFLRKETGYIRKGYVPSLDLRFNYFAYLNKNAGLNPWNTQVGLLWRVF